MRSLSSSQLSHLILTVTSLVGNIIVSVESEEVGLKLNIQKTKIMASSPTTSWEIDGGTVSEFIFLGSKITANGDCSHEIKRHLLLGRKVMTNLDSILLLKTFITNRNALQIILLHTGYQKLCTPRFHGL